MSIRDRIRHLEVPEDLRRYRAPSERATFLLQLLIAACGTLAIGLFVLYVLSLYVPGVS